MLTRQEAIEEIVKGSFELTEEQAIHLSGVILGMAITNSINKKVMDNAETKYKN